MDRTVNRPLRTTCILRLPAAIENHSQSPGPSFVYVCNCNGLRKRDVAAAIEAGATRPRDVFARNQCAAQCAKCVCEMREMIQETRQAFAMAAE
jgi:bacterioferritin-associated ferredoxin